jgi:hypothetical protein
VVEECKSLHQFRPRCFGGEGGGLSAGGDCRREELRLTETVKDWLWGIEALRVSLAHSTETEAPSSDRLHVLLHGLSAVFL